MSASADRPSTPSGGGGGKLESLSKEDVIKFAKRQTMLLSKAKARIDELSKKVESTGDGNFQEEIGRLKEELKKSAEEKGLIEEELEDTKEKLSQTRSRYAEVEEERLSAVTAYQSLQVTLEQTQGNQSEAIQSLEEKVKQLNTQLGGLEEENECLKMQKASTVESVKTIQSEYQQLLTEKEGLHAQHQETVNELAESNKLKEKLIVNFKALKQKYLEMKRDTETQSPDQSSQSVANSEENERLKSQIESLNQELSECQNTLSQLNSEHDSLKTDHTSVSADCESLKAQYESLKTEYDSFKNENNSITIECESLRTQCDSLKGECETLKTEYESLHLRHINQSEVMAEMEKKQEAEDIITQHKEEIAGWQKRIEEMSQDYEHTISQNKEEITALQTEVEELRNSQSQSKLRVEELVLGLGKESAGIISSYEEKILGYQAEREQLLNTIQEMTHGAEKNSINTGNTAQKGPGQAAESTNEGDSQIAPANQIPCENDVKEAVIEDVISAQAAPLVEGGVEDPNRDRDAKIVHQELEQEKQLTRSLQEMMKSLTETLRGLENENQALRESRVSSGADSTIRVNSDLQAKLGEKEKLIAQKEEQIQKMASKLSELINYSAKLKAKSKMIVEANDQLTATVEQLERKIQNDARGARNIQLHFQEAENNVNEQIAHFHQQRDEMIAQVNEYASSIETVRAQMMPYRETEKECLQIIYEGLCSVAEFCKDVDKASGGSLVEMAKLLVNTAQRMKGQYIISLHHSDSLKKTEGGIKRIALNWRWRYEEECLKYMALEKKIARLEERIVEMGGSTDLPGEEAETSVEGWKLEGEPMEHAEMEKEVGKFAEDELSRLYKEHDKQCREIAQLRQELSEKDDMLVMLKADQSEQLQNEGADVKSKQTVNSSSRTLTSTMAQTDNQGDMSKRLQVQKEIIDSLREELAKQSESQSELEQLKSQLQDDWRLNDLNERLEVAETQLGAKSREIEQHAARIERLKSQISQQTDQLLELKVQLTKNQLQEKFQLQVGDTRGAEVQASLSDALLNLRTCNEEKEALQVQVEKLEADISLSEAENVGRMRKMIEMNLSIEELKAEKVRLTDEIENVNARNENLFEEREKLATRYENLRMQLTEQQRSADVSAMENGAAELSQSIEEMTNEFHAKLVTDIEALQADKDSLNRQLADISEERDQLTRTVEDLQKERELVDNEVERLKTVQCEASDHLTRLSSEHSVQTDKLNQECTSQQHKISHMEEELKQLNVKVESNNAEYSQMVEEKQKLELEVSTLREQTQRLNELVEGSTSDVQNFKGQYDEKCNQVSTLTEQVELMQQRANEDGRRAQNLQTQIDSVTEQLAQSETHAADLQAQNSDLQNRLKDVELLNKSPNLEGQCSELRKAVENVKSERNELQDSLDAKSHELAELTNKLSILQTQNSDFQEMDKQHQMVLVDLKDQITQLTKRCTINTSEIEKLTNECAISANEVERLTLGLKDQSNEAAEEMRKVNENLTALRSEKTGLQQELDSSDLKINDLQTQIEALTLKNDQDIREKDELADTLSSTKGENENLEEKVKSQEAEMLKLTAELDDSSKQLTQLTQELDTLRNTMETSEGLVKQSENQQVEIERLSKLVAELQKDADAAKKELMESSMSSQASTTSEDPSPGDAGKMKELEERANKFKLLALKAKKELVESRNQADKLKAELQEKSANKVGDMQTLVNNYQHLQQDFDRLQDDLDSEKAKVTSLQGQLGNEQTTSSQLQMRLASLVEEKEQALQNNSQLLAKIKAGENQLGDLRTKMVALEAELDAKHIELSELNKNSSRLTEQMKMNEGSSKSLEDKLRSKISELELKVHEARDELEQANKTMSKSSVMHLEIADFERTVSNLQAEVKDKDETISNLKEELSHQQQKYSSIESELASADEQRRSVEVRCEKLQHFINKTKEELDEARQQETESKTTDLAMRGELEILRQQHEELKVEMATISSARLVAEDKLKVSQESQHRLMRSMENKQRALQNDLENSRSELTVLQQDYDGYKVRVHSVLKQQQTRASIEAALESEKVEKAHLQEVLNQLKTKLQETSEKLQASLSENSLLQDELDKLSLRHNKQSQELTNKETVWRQRLDQLMAENSTIASEHSSAISQMTQHSEVMTLTFKEQMKASQTEYELQISNINNKVERLEDEKASLAGEVQSLRRQLGNVKPEQVKSSRQNSRQQSSSPLTASNQDLKYNVRESGEGMEHPQPLQIPPSPVANIQITPNTTVGLENLLTSAEDDSASVVSLNTQASEGGDEAKLKSRLQLSEKQLEHLRELLNDSEATCLRYNEQVKILKQEIRRLESNQMRENSISNMEYLKNIVYKFLSLEAGDERSRLLPVLHTMLKFTEEELSTLKVIASTGTEGEVTGQGQSSWSGYLHRWTGFSS